MDANTLTNILWQVKLFCHFHYFISPKESCVFKHSSFLDKPHDEHKDFILHCCCCCVMSVVSDSVRPHRRQPTRLPHPWNSPGKNTGVGCHFLLQCMKVKSESEVALSCLTLRDPMDCSPPGSSVHGIFQARVLEWGAIVFSIILHYLYINLVFLVHFTSFKGFQKFCEIKKMPYTILEYFDF